MQGPKEIGDIETDDEKDEEEQYEQWKSREMRRIRWVIMHPVRYNHPWPSVASDIVQIDTSGLNNDRHSHQTPQCIYLWTFCSHQEPEVCAGNDTLAGHCAAYHW